MKYVFFIFLFFSSPLTLAKDHEISLDSTFTRGFKSIMTYCSPKNAALLGQTCKINNNLFKHYEPYAILHHLWSKGASLMINDFNLTNFFHQNLGKSLTIDEIKQKLDLILNEKRLTTDNLTSLKFDKHVSREQFIEGFHNSVELPLSFLLKISKYFKELKTCHLDIVRFTHLGPRHISFIGSDKVYWNNDKGSSCYFYETPRSFAFHHDENTDASRLKEIENRVKNPPLLPPHFKIVPFFKESDRLPLLPSSITDLSLRGCHLGTIGLSRLLKGLDNLETLNISLNPSLVYSDIGYIPYRVATLTYTEGQFYEEVLTYYLKRFTVPKDKEIKLRKD